MKPQDSKSNTQSLSPTQEGARASSSLENLSPDLEKSSLKTEKEIFFSQQQLQDIITELERDIANGSAIKGNYHYANTDFRLLPALIEQANRKHEGLNLKLITTSQELISSIKEARDNGVLSARYIVNMTDRGIHSVLLDQRTIADKTSLIMLEPATLDSESAFLLSIRLHIIIQRELPECHFSKCVMDIQRSSSECGIFCLALAKKLHTNADKLTRMHQDNINGVLCEPNTTLPPEKSDQYLPAGFYKHTQGTRRLREYIRSNPETENEKVNKKGETLRERFDKNLVTTEEKTVSVSIQRKRVSEYKSLML
ncbi:YopJ/AvrA family T3SS effector serine/threonine acetyltransferase [Bartonella machadoae]|uniref:YopJ/AvrA family T3SS effector serine/threonine acetyltransferase n=1 Tax=Bartonella machadoae TaxID=2893471 RepID=UPI001F4CCCB0|nr:YopJ/AvrA family T3SS effector serine/threonine acetyltransferase [Bartonella machadoae]UNE53960.1 YopJ family type III secretion system effector serine/threonine acetyltransferase [Bartonella machadoae]